jgi:hypothetical protein
MQGDSVCWVFGQGPPEDSVFRTRRDRSYPTLIKVFGFALTAYVMSLRI